MLTISLLRRTPRCLQLRSLNGLGSIRTSLCSGSHDIIKSYLSTKSDADGKTQPVYGENSIANNPGEMATIIASRLTEKEIGLVLRSFGCALNRPSRVCRITTRNKIDVAWMNVWFARLYSDRNFEFFPVTIPPPMDLESSGRQLYDSIKNANKHKNSEFFTNLAEGKKNSSITSGLAAAATMEEEINIFINEHLTKVPVNTTTAIAATIDKFSCEEISEITLKRMLRKMAGAHSNILPVIFSMLGMPFNTVRIVTYEYF